LSDLGHRFGLSAIGALSEGGRHDRQEHPIRGRTVEVVNAMGVGQPIERTDMAAAEPPETLMDVHVVDEAIMPIPTGTSAPNPSQLNPAKNPALTIAAKTTGYQSLVSQRASRAW
jgi:hypothetical protein